MKVTKEKFYECLKRMDSFVPFPQSQGWEEYKSDTANGHLYFVDNVDSPCMACSGRVFVKRFVGAILDIDGEVYRGDIGRKNVTSFFKSLIEDAGVNIILYSSCRPYEVQEEIGLRCAGMNRLMGGTTCPLTQMIDILSERNYDRKWRRNLKKAEENGLTFEYVEKPTDRDMKVFCHLFDELVERKSLGFTVRKEPLKRIFKHPEYKLFFVRHEGKVECARLVYVHKGNAVDVFAANSFESMNYSATHFICEKIFEWLKPLGIRTFDFARISPSDNETNNIYIFKNAAGGYSMQYLGEWIWTRKPILKLMFGVYNFFTRKHLW